MEHIKNFFVGLGYVLWFCFLAVTIFIWGPVWVMMTIGDQVRHPEKYRLAEGEV